MLFAKDGQLVGVVYFGVPRVKEEIVVGCKVRAGLDVEDNVDRVKRETMMSALKLIVRHGQFHVLPKAKMVRGGSIPEV